MRFLEEPEEAPAAGTATASTLEGLRDAFTGAPLDPARGLHVCRRCTVHYHAESVQVLRAENQGRCVACGGTEIRPVPAPPPMAPAPPPAAPRPATPAVPATRPAPPRAPAARPAAPASPWTPAARPAAPPVAPPLAPAAPGRNHVPDVVTLRTYQRYEGRVVTFEGRVSGVLTSRRGTDYAVMFEPKPWVKGLKLVFFRGTLGRFGGPPAILGLAGKTVRVRGLLVRHETYGWQIVVTEPSMLLAVA